VNRFKRLIGYLINPRPNLEAFHQEITLPRVKKSTLKGIFNPPMVLGLIIVIGLLAIMLFGPLLATYDPYLTSQTVRSHFDAELNKMISPPFDPSPEHPLGTDTFGNDILSLIFYGARVTLVTCFYITIARVIVGLLLGGLSGWFEGTWVDKVIMKVGGVIASFPLLLSSMIMIYALDITKGLWVFVVTISVLGWTEISQLVRGEFIRIREMLYIEAAEALGLTRIQVVIRHALPNVLSYLFSILFLEMGAVLLLMAELGYLGVFIGGGSVYKSDPLSPVVIQINEVPEWGALVAQGAPSLRSYPFMVLGPAAAFFIAIIGLNALGEGIRRIFERWPFSTAFLLKKRMFLILALSVGLTAFVFEQTSAKVSYHKLGAAFSAERALEHVETMAELEPYSQTIKENQLVEYMKEHMREFEAGRGYSSSLLSYYHFPGTTTLIRADQEPVLQVGGQARFHLKNEYGFVVEGCAGEGRFAGELALLASPEVLTGDEIQERDLKGKVIMVEEVLTREGFFQKALDAGAGGVLLVNNQDPPVRSEIELTGDPAQYHCPAEKELPVFRITSAAARVAAGEAGLNWKSVEENPDQELALIETGVPVTMEIDLTEPQQVEVPNAVGFYGGYDMNHAAEIVVVYTTYDGLGLKSEHPDGLPSSELVEIASLLEMMESWETGSLDPRRSVMFVIWGGEGVESPFFDLIYGLYQENKLTAEVPTNTNPFQDDNPVKPAFWLEVGDLGTESDTLAYSQGSDQELGNMFDQAAKKAHLEARILEPPDRPANSGLPSLYLWDPAPLKGDQTPDVENWALKGEAISHTLIRLLRDVD